MNNCNVCCDSLNKTVRKEIKCLYCDYSSCRKCIQKYLLESIQEAHCMNCKKVWNDDFLTESLTKVFITGEYKINRQTILLNKQKALLPDTQHNVIAEKQIRDLNVVSKNIYNSITELKARIKEYELELIKNEGTIYRLTEVRNNKSSENVVKAKFIRKCPLNECKGFLSTQWKCGTCSNFVCNKCNELKIEDHECDPEKVSTIELLNKDTKPCPNCGTMIFKIQGGCDQMYCVDCNTAFSWRKGTIETGVIHNPHYYEFLRKTSANGEIPRNPGDCCNNDDNFPRYYTLLSVLQRYNTIDTNTVNLLSNIHNVCTHIQYGINNRNNHVRDSTQEKLNYRIMYLLNEISEEEWKINLFQLERKYKKFSDYNGIYQMFITVVGDSFRKIINFQTNENTKGIKDLIKNELVVLENLRKYFNESIEKVGKKYSTVYPILDSKFVYNSSSSLKKKK